jgi:hypothetical protein
MHIAWVVDPLLKFTKVYINFLNFGRSFFTGELSSDFKTPANGPVVLDEKHQVAVKILKKV